MSIGASRGVTLLALLAAAGAYFALSCTLTLEWSDEGHIVYPSWRVAQGAVPYRDFQQLYGPSVFFLNGSLLRLFGEDLLVIRVALVVLKALAAVLVYLCACRVAVPACALTVYVLMVLVWGTPWWVFNTPYANHYALTLNLIGLLAFCSVRRFFLGCAVAGLCFGLAATFKLTSGLFAVVALLLFVLFATDAEHGAVRRMGRTAISWSLGAARVLCVAGTLALFATYVRPRNDLWTLVVLFTPLLATLTWLVTRAWRAALDTAGGGPRLLSAVVVGCGAALPLAVYAIYYARNGWSADFVFNLATGVPQMVRWFDPFPLPTVRSLLWAGTLITTCVWLRLARLAQLSPRYRPAAWALLTAVAVGVLAVLADVVWRDGGVRTYARTGAWLGDSFRLYFFIPPLTVWASLGTLWRQDRPGAMARLGVADDERRRARVLFHLWAVTSLFLLYPAADFWHVIMTLPAFLPLLAVLLERCVVGAPQPGHGALGRGSIGLIGVLLTVLTGPLVFTLGKAIRDRPTGAGLSRASKISGAQPKFGETVRLVAYLEQRDPAVESLLVLADEQMVYFLAGKPSAVEKAEYVFYLTGAGLIDVEDARRIAPESMIIERIEGARPLIVDYAGSPMSARFRDTFPSVARYVDSRYVLEYEAGKYRVLCWSGDPPRLSVPTGPLQPPERRDSSSHSLHR